jgi:hypothetical protein
VQYRLHTKRETIIILVWESLITGIISVPLETTPLIHQWPRLETDPFMHLSALEEAGIIPGERFPLGVVNNPF